MLAQISWFSSDARPGASLQADVITVAELLADTALSLPEYQRPYKWQSRHVEQLFDDLLGHREKMSYRLGTLVLHCHDTNGKLRNDIVDGQQRTLTLMLTVMALADLISKQAKTVSAAMRERVAQLAKDMMSPCISSDIACHNLQQNYQVILRRISRPDFDERAIAFLLDRCQLVRIRLANISEAFQFFDAQNARGRDLAPHDLLKAFHLREFGDTDMQDKLEAVMTWENSDSHELETLLGQYLFRIRRWVRGESARHFSKEDIGLFKGVSLGKGAPHPAFKLLALADASVPPSQVPGFPFQLDQAVINGRRFFQMISHYKSHGIAHTGRTWPENWPKGEKLEGFAREIVEVLDTYDGRRRTGDRYVRVLFDSLLLYYQDRFGDAEWSRAVEKAFIWAYALRLEKQVVQLASMDNHVLERNLFRVLRETVQPADFLRYPLPEVKERDFAHPAALVGLFRKMGYMAETGAVT